MYKMRRKNIKYLRNKKGQAAAEMALFGSLVLFIFGILLSYVQRFNEQQYVQMETFRRALEKANSGLDTGEASEDGAGASVQFSFIENRKHTDLQGGFRKGNTQTFSGSSSVFWAVPKVGKEAKSLIVYRINQDENVYNYRDFVPKDKDRFDEKGEEREVYWTFEPGDMNSDTEAHFNERVTKQENTGGITNISTSELRERVHTNIPFRVLEKNKDNKDYEQEVRSGALVDFNQHLYRDAEGQYKFSAQAGDAPVIRGKQWETGF